MNIFMMVVFVWHVMSLVFLVIQRCQRIRTKVLTCRPIFYYSTRQQYIVHYLHSKSTITKQFHTFNFKLALWSFQWVAPPKMYFTAAVSWTKASICSGSRLRHQLQIDFITHSNPQLGIANATLMRARNPKQVYIVFCPPVRGAAEMIRTPTTFRQDFSCSIFALQHFSDFVDQMLPASWLFTQRNGDLRWTNPGLCSTISQVSNTHWPVTMVHEATSNDIITFCDTWQFVCARQLTTW